MSASAKLTKKQKKGLAFRERGSKKNAKAPEVDEDGVPIQEIQDLIEGNEEVHDEKTEATKKGKRVEDGGKGKAKANLKEVKSLEKDAADVEDSATQKTKKRKLSQVDGAEGDAVTNTKKKKIGPTQVGDGAKHEETTKGEKARYILFVGKSSLYSTHPFDGANL